MVCRTLLVLALACVASPAATAPSRGACRLPSFDGVLRVTVPGRCKLATSRCWGKPGWHATFTDAKDPSWELQVSFEFVPATDLEHAKRLIAAESLPVASDIRRWDTPLYGGVTLGTDAALSLTVDGQSDGRHHLVPLAGGVLVIHCNRTGQDSGSWTRECSDVAADLLAAFKQDRGGLALARRRYAKAKSPALRPPPRVPTTLEETFTELKQLLCPEEIAAMRRMPEREMIQYHHGLGTELRNEWRLWRGGPLSDFFTKKGVRHPDGMSAIILEGFWRHLHGKPIRLEQLVQRHRH